MDFTRGSREELLMAVTQAELQAFSEFALQRLSNNSVDTLYELVDEWETQQLSGDELTRNAVAIQASIDGMDAGDKGRPARSVIAEMRTRHNVPDA